MEPKDLLADTRDEARLEGATLATQGLSSVLNSKLIPVIFMLSLLQKAPRLPADVDQMLRQAIEHLESTMADTRQTMDMLLQVPEFWEWSRREHGERFRWLDDFPPPATPEPQEPVRGFVSEDEAKQFNNRIYRDNLELARRCKRLENRVRELEQELAVYRGSRPIARTGDQ